MPAGFCTSLSWPFHFISCNVYSAAHWQWRSAPSFAICALRPSSPLLSSSRADNVKSSLNPKSGSRPRRALLLRNMAFQLEPQLMNGAAPERSRLPESTCSSSRTLCTSRVSAQIKIFPMQVLCGQAAGRPMLPASLLGPPRPRCTPSSATFVVLQLQRESHAFLLKNDFPCHFVRALKCSFELGMHVEYYT